MRLVPLLAATAAALLSDDDPNEDWDGQPPYNASSPLIPIAGFDLSKALNSNGQGSPANWTVGQRIKYNTTTKYIYQYTYFTGQGDHVQDALEDWSFSYKHYSGPLRNSTDPIKADCSNVLSPRCVNAITAFGSKGSGFNENAGCPFMFLGGTGRKAAGLQHADKRADGVFTSFVDVLHATHSYDEMMRSTIVFYSTWSYKGVEMGNTTGCFGMEHFEKGARTLADILGVKAAETTTAGSAEPSATTKPADNKTNGTAGDKADGKSAASVVTASVSWVVGLVGLYLAL